MDDGSRWRRRSRRTSSIYWHGSAAGRDGTIRYTEVDGDKPMEKVLSRIAPYCYALMRIVVGVLFSFHGAQKLFGLFGGRQVPLISQMGLAGVIEFVAGLMIAAG